MLRFLYDIDEELVGYCEQEESVRETSSYGDSANYYLHILLQVNGATDRRLGSRPSRWVA